MNIDLAKMNTKQNARKESEERLAEIEDKMKELEKQRLIAEKLMKDQQIDSDKEDPGKKPSDTTLSKNLKDDPKPSTSKASPKYKKQIVKQFSDDEDLSEEGDTDYIDQFMKLAKIQRGRKLGKMTTMLYSF